MTTTALDKRKAFILQTVVYEYINTAEPVGSMTLTQKYNLGVSLRDDSQRDGGARSERLSRAAAHLERTCSLGCRLPHVRRRVDVARNVAPRRHAAHSRRVSRGQPRSRWRHRANDATARATLAQPCFRNRAGALDADVPSHSTDLVLGTHGTGGRRDIARHADANAVRAEIGRERRQSHASF